MSTYDHVVQQEVELARLSALMRAVPANPLRHLANQLRGKPGEGSPYEHDLNNTHADADSLGLASAFALLWTIDAMPQYFDALDGVFSAASGRRHGPRPLIRAIVEHAGRAAWLMEPEIGPRRRAARALLTEVVSADQLQTAMNRGDSEEAAGNARDRQARVRQRITQLFGDEAFKTPRSWPDWTLASERYMSMTQIIEALAARHFPGHSGGTFYMFQSVLLHPSAASATVFATRQTDGSIDFPDFDPTFTKRSAVATLSCWRAAMSDVLSYHGWTCSEFEEWSIFADAAISEVHKAVTE